MLLNRCALYFCRYWRLRWKPLPRDFVKPTVLTITYFKKQHQVVPLYVVTYGVL
jgi:hypothetical protein